ncbi:MAG: hypothetical protein JST80_09830 [Bdellovibrionales bacterium]|nr:hypothetical protein [Bdellovibrionales bacterium]
MQTETENRVAKYASIQAMAEIGLGSFIHALHIPVGGHVLSINQLVCLGLTSRNTRIRGVAVTESMSVTTIVTLLKTLSPAGKRLMPMLAIFMQGMLFSLGLGVLGANVVGIIVGSAMSSLWAFIQPLTMAYLLFGLTFFQAFVRIWEDLAKQLHINPEIGIWFISALVIGKMVLACAAGAAAWTADERFEARYLARVDQWWRRARGNVPQAAARTRKAGPFIGAFLDLLSPLFLASLLLCVIFLKAEGWPFAARTVGVTYMFFLALRLIPVEKLRRVVARYPSLDRAYRAVLNKTE